MSEVERVVIPPTPKPDQTDAENAAIERAKSGTDKPPATDPSLILGKFKSQADLEAAYKELEKKLGVPKEGEKTDAEKAAAEAAKAAEAKPEGNLTIKPAPTADESDKAFKVFEDEFAAQGKLSDSSYEALTKMGIPRRVVDNHIASLQGSKDNYARQAHDAAGGSDKFTAMQSWANTNASPELTAAYNSLIGTGDSAKLKEGILLLKNAYDSATGSEPTLIDGGPKATAAVGFLNMREMSAAQRDPRYGKDARYMADFHAKVKAMK